jgi:hypothetical protein
MDEGLQVGNHVTVENHGKYWPHRAQIINIDMETNIALIRWETTRKVDLVHLKDLKQFLLNDATPRKWKSTDFLCSPFWKKNALTEQHQYDRSNLQGCTENRFIQRRTPLSCALKVQLGT